MVLAGSLVGLIELYDIVPRDFSGLSAAFEASRHLLAGAFAKATLLDRLEQGNRELRHQNRRLSSLLDAGRAITSTLVVEDVLDTLARKSAEAVGAPECLIYEFDLAEGLMTVRSDYCAPGSAHRAHRRRGHALPYRRLPDGRRDPAGRRARAGADQRPRARPGHASAPWRPGARRAC